MDAEELLKIAASIARGVNPKTGAPLDTQRVELPINASDLNSKLAKNPNQSAGLSKWSAGPLLIEQQALLRSFAEANALSLLSLDEFLSRKRIDSMASLRAIGADEGEGWSLIKLQWTIEYWRERALLAEAKLRGDG